MAHHNEHEEHCHSHGCSCCCEQGHDHHEEEEMNWWKPALSLTMLVAGIIMGTMDISLFRNGWVKLAWYALAWLPTGLGVLREAIEEAREGDFFSEFLLMTVASLGAFAIGEYPEAVAVMALYCIGEALQDRAVNRARGNIKSLIALRPDQAVIIRDGQRLTVTPDEVTVGDLIEVKAGERVPVDGRLTESAAAFDTAALTGESLPRIIESGDEVLAGMIASESKRTQGTRRTVHPPFCQGLHPRCRWARRAGSCPTLALFAACACVILL